ncbi:MAG TPA: LysR family transcriptional regulator [Chloroflexota bacterium]
MDFAVNISSTDVYAAPSLYYLRTFHAVATERSFTRAGRRLGLSQPAVSAQIRALERHYGGRLFELWHRRVHLTAEGEALLPYAERVLGLLREADDAVAATRGLERGQLSLGASATIGNYLLPPLLARFTAAHPALRVEVAIGTTAAIAARVVGDELPFGLVEAPVAHADLQVRPFARDEMVLITPPEHPWARAGRVSRDDLRGTPLLRREAGSGTRTLVDHALDQAGVATTVAAVLGSTEALKGAVLAGLGVAWVPRLAVARELVAGELAAVPVAGVEVSRTLSVVAPAGRILSPAGRAFLAFLEESERADAGSIIN